MTQISSQATPWRLLLASWSIVVAGLAVASESVAQSTPSADYPASAVRIVVPYTPSGLTDVIIRRLAKELTTKWGVPVIVENKPGGNSTIGTAHVARSVPDGHTLLFASTAFVNTASLMKLPYTLEQFTPLLLAASAPNVLYIHPSVPATNMKELIAYGKSHPSALRFASTGNGTTPHLTAELFAAKAGIEMIHVPYKGSGQALTDLMGGQVNAMFHFPASLTLVKQGKLRAIAVASDEPLRDAPTVPTLKAAGMSGVVSTTWFALFAPAAVPASIKDKIHRDAAEIVGSPSFQTFLKEAGLDYRPLSQPEFAAFIAKEREQWGSLIRQRGIKLE